MFIFILILMMIIIASSTVSGKNEFNSDYISKDGTTPIKGIFVILIVLSHAKGYFVPQLSGIWDEAYIAVQSHIGQMVVAMFLFYSGYGIMEQIKKREFSYIKSIPAKRFPSLLLNYDIAVVFYVILALCLKNRLSLGQVLLSFVAWNGIGNSSWYIFDTLILYLLTIIAFSFIGKLKSKKLYILNIALLTALGVGMVYVLQLVGKESWWYNTALLFVLGFWYSYFKAPIEKLVMKNDITYLFTAAAVTVLYILAFLNRGNGLVSYYLFGVMFVLLTVTLTMKVKLESKLLNWFGDHVFSVYILQRIPMIIMHNMGLSTQHRYIFVILSFVISCAIAEGYDIAFSKLSKKIWKAK